VLNEETTRSALQSLWKYNFARNLDAYDQQSDPKGRPYFTDGEGGLVMTANALGREVPFGIYSPFACYLSETMNGFEYQAAAHMIAEDMVTEGLAIIRTVDERYDGHKRNPFNEVECGDHYARSMAVYGALLTISGFEYHGPQGYIAFAPKITPETFKAPFTAAEGWGTYAQRIEPKLLDSQLSVKFGKLKVKTISLGLPNNLIPTAAKVSLNGKNLASSLTCKEGKAIITLAEPAMIQAGESLELLVGE
jgi:hypothetical protein